MKFKLQTLADITSTGSRRQDDDKFAHKQEANFQTVLQTIGLRVNLEYETKPCFTEVSISKIGFGDKYKGKQKVWSFDFEIPYEGALTLDMLQQDFDLIPFIPGLTETAKFEQALFRTTPQERNIVFSIVD